MCFSAKASFVAAGTLSIIGLLSVKKAKHNYKLLPFASTPLLFALQQACEGLVWVGVTQGIPIYVYKASVYGFIFFAGPWWPVWIPLVLHKLEDDPFRKKLLLILIVIGVITAAIYLVSFATQPVQALVINHHLYYPTLSYPLGSTNTVTKYIESALIELYPIASVLPLFCSSIQYIWLAGIAMGALGITSKIFYHPTAASTWCFFAAVASMFIYAIVCKNAKKITDIQANIIYSKVK